MKLRNRPFAHLFEVIGAMYALPKYGTIDLTRFFAPFYMIFFGFCMAEAVTDWSSCWAVWPQ